MVYLLFHFLLPLCVVGLRDSLGVAVRLLVGSQAKDLAEVVMQGIFEWNMKNDVLDAERPT